MPVAQHEKMLQWWSSSVPILHAHATAFSKPAATSVEPPRSKSQRMQALINLPIQIKKDEMMKNEQSDKNALSDAIDCMMGLDRLKIISRGGATAEARVL